MIMSQSLLSLLVYAAMAGAIAAPLILVALFIRDWKRKELW